MNSGKLFIVSGPSGSGKDTVLQEVFKSHNEILFSISTITREMREGEVQDGKYHFVTRDEFERALYNGEMLEHNVYLDNYYGTPKKPVDDAIANDKEIIVEVDVNGEKNIKKIYPDAVSIFIMPPSLAVLKKRLSRRGTESEEQVKRRMKIALREIAEAKRYDYVVVNDVLEDAVEDFISIIVSNRSSIERKINTVNEVLKDAESCNW